MHWTYQNFHFFVICLHTRRRTGIFRIEGTNVRKVWSAIIIIYRIRIHSDNCCFYTAATRLQKFGWNTIYQYVYSHCLFLLKAFIRCSQCNTALHQPFCARLWWLLIFDKSMWNKHSLLITLPKFYSSAIKLVFGIQTQLDLFLWCLFKPSGNQICVNVARYGRMG